MHWVRTRWESWELEMWRYKKKIIKYIIAQTITDIGEWQ